MIDTTHPQPLKDMVYGVQAYLHWSEVYQNTQEWEALRNKTNFECRLRELLPQCLAIIKQEPLVIDSE